MGSSRKNQQRSKREEARTRERSTRQSAPRPSKHTVTEADRKTQSASSSTYKEPTRQQSYIPDLPPPQW